VGARSAPRWNLRLIATALAALLVVGTLLGVRYYREVQATAATYRASQDARAALKSAASQIDLDAKKQADEVEVQAQQATLLQLQQREKLARTDGDHRAVAAEARSLQEQAVALAAETDQIQQDAASLKVAHPGDLQAIRKAGEGAVTGGRNEATIGAYLKLAAVDRPYQLLERYGGRLNREDVDLVAIAAAGALRYGQQVHELLAKGMPAKTIVISLEAQQLRAYENGRVVRETLVTTGRPELPTDVGAMKVLRKSSPWKMHSPWPKGSPYWYPDAMVQQVIWFTNTGEGMHDASWEADEDYGPGSQYGPSASHGCVHVLAADERFLYDWSTIGMPVVVYPGDGTPVDRQMARITVDANGQPTTGPRGS
jgi:lipoprotein-anchoring transpeptidase ErfK/SrfK